MLYGDILLIARLLLPEFLVSQEWRKLPTNRIAPGTD
jgi:hypothetical protein